MPEFTLNNLLQVDTAPFFTHLLDNSKLVALFILDKEGVIIEVNQGVENSFGYKKEDLIGKNFSTLFIEEDRLANKPEMEVFNVLEKGSSSDENYLLCKKGNPQWSMGESVFVRDSKDEIFIVKIVQEINEKKLLEKFLTDSTKISEDILQASLEPIIILDEGLKILKYNKAFIELVGFAESNETIINQPLFKVANSIFNIPAFINTLQEVRDSNHALKDIDLEVDIHEKKFFRIRASRVGALENKKLIVAFNDVSPLKNLQQQLLFKIESLKTEQGRLDKINKDFNNFVHTASHDLRSPINNIQGLVDLLTYSIPPEAEDFKIIKLLKESTEVLKTRLHDLTIIGSAQEQEALSLSPLSFEEILQEVKFDLQKDIAESQAQIIADFSSVPNIYFSKPNLRSIIFNLVSNAIKYRSPKRSPIVEISTAYKGNDTVVLSVKDNGIGIKEEDKSKVFSMYKRLHTHVDGKGIGMALVSRIVSNNGGDIELSSKVGKGSTFNIYLKIPYPIV